MSCGVSGMIWNGSKIAVEGVQWAVVWCGAVRCGAVRCGVGQCSAVQCSRQ